MPTIGWFGPALTGTEFRLASACLREFLERGGCAAASCCAGWAVFQSASLAAIFIGCTSVMATPSSLPHPSWIRLTGSTTTIASFAARGNSSRLRPRSRCQQATPSTTKQPVIRPASTTCTNAMIVRR